MILCHVKKVFIRYMFESVNFYLKCLELVKLG